MKIIISKIIKVLSSTLVALIVTLAILLVGVRLFGLQVYFVMSGSMEPNYKTGSLIYVKEIEPSELAVDDVITFKLTVNTTATHRIIEIIPKEENRSNLSFKTKGDANNAPDASLVNSKDIIGVPIFTIPYLGYLASYIQQPPGMYIALTTSIIFILFVFIADLFTNDKKQKDKC